MVIKYKKCTWVIVPSEIRAKQREAEGKDQKPCIYVYEGRILQ